jgi:hypothetical protein
VAGMKRKPTVDPCPNAVTRVGHHIRSGHGGDMAETKLAEPYYRSERQLTEKMEKNRTPVGVGSEPR